MSCCPTCGQAVAPDELLVSLDTHKAARNGVEVHLTPNETVLLFLLVDKAPATARKPYLLDGIYGVFGDIPEDANGALKVLVSHLRKKIVPLDDVEIHTVRGEGYRANVASHLNA